ncbi:MAG TPA: HEAT repeat domain-containing protein, partial [Candidatus Obscuribacterales bacterium]
IAQDWKDDPDTLPWLKDRVQLDDHWQVRSAAVRAIAQDWKDDPDTLPMLKDRVLQDDYGIVRSAAVEAIAQGWKDDPDTLPMLKDRVLQDDAWQVRRAAAAAIAQGWKDDPEVIQLLLQVAMQDPFKRESRFQDNPRLTALEALLRQAPTAPNIMELLRDRAEHDGDEQLRDWAQERLGSAI